MNAPQPVRSPIDGFTVDALIRGAARLRAGRTAMSFSGEGAPVADPLSFGDVARSTEFLALSLAACGLRPGERLFVLGAAEPATVLLILAGLRLGLDVATMPLGAEADEIETAAASVAPQAVAAPARCGDIATATHLFRIAGSVSSVRFVGLHGGDEDGAVRLDDEGFEPPQIALGSAEGALITFVREGGGLQAKRHAQTVLVAAGLDLMARAQIGIETPILSPLSPTRFAGFVAGPMASLLSGAELRLHAPFDLGGFRRAIVRQPVHVLVPARAAASVLDEIPRGAQIATLLPLCRDGQTPALADPPCPVCDLHAVGEIAIAPLMREKGRPAALDGLSHVLPIDSGHIVALESRQSQGGLEWRGAAVSGGEEWRRS